LGLIAWAIAAGSCLAAEPPLPEENPSAAAASEAGSKRALLICGLSGDAARHKAYAETVAKVHAALVTKLGFDSGEVHVLFGDEAIGEDPEPIRTASRATREEVGKHIQLLRENSRPDDALWVIVFGHTHYDGRNSWLNLPGPDLHQHEFAKLFADFPAGQQVFLITTPASGFFIKPLSARNRVVISATEADWETNETEFAAEFARILESSPSAKELDVDQDEQVTLFDLYLVTARNLAQSYRDRELLATEHSLLDDNGDGRGTEIQIDFLSTELGGRLKGSQPGLAALAPKSDGHLARSIRLSLP
jgi:hypothetical protein